MADTTGNLVLLLREGDLFDVGNEDWRQITAFDYIFDYQRSPAFNAAGHFAFTLYFTDGSNGIFIAHVPEPEMLSCSAAVTGLLLLTRKRSLLSVRNQFTATANP